MASRRAMAAEPEGPAVNHAALPEQVAGQTVAGGDVTPVRLHPVPLKYAARPVTPLRQGETFQQRLDAFGLDEVLEMLSSGQMLVQVAEAADVSTGALLQWYSKDPERRAAVMEARRMAAALWDENAEHVVHGAGNWFQLEQAKQLASHYRWRAAKIDVQGYGEKQSIEHNVKPLPMEEVDAKLLQLAGFWAQLPPTQPAMQLPREITDTDVIDAEDISELDDVLR